MRVLVSGASGLVGKALYAKLRERGDEVVRLIRMPETLAVVGEIATMNKTPPPDIVSWDPMTGQVDAARLEGFDAVVHLAGAGIAEGRWSAKRKAEIRDSRVVGTGNLAKVISRLERKPSVFVSASAVGFYGDRGDEVLTEESARGEGFLAETAEAWEWAAGVEGVRVVCARLGVVLSVAGGALGKMVGPFRLGLGGKVGTGLQYWPCIGLTDVVRALCFLIDEKGMEGAVNVVGPASETNLGFTMALGDVLRRPTVLPLPGFAVKVLLGEMGEALLLSSSRVLPRKLEAAGFEFLDGNVEEMLERAVGGG